MEKVELYYAVMNIADYLALYQEKLKFYEKEKLYFIMDDLIKIGEIDIPSLAEANDCGYQETMHDVVLALRELFKNGERVAIK